MTALGESSTGTRLGGAGGGGAGGGDAAGRIAAGGVEGGGGGSEPGKRARTGLPCAWAAACARSGKLASPSTAGIVSSKSTMSWLSACSTGRTWTDATGGGAEACLAPAADGAPLWLGGALGTG